MQNRYSQRLKEAQRKLELYSDNVMLSQKALQTLQTQYAQALTDVQEDLQTLEAPLRKAQALYEEAQKQFERAQSVFAQEQLNFNKAQEQLNNKRQGVIRQGEAGKKQLAGQIEKQTRELKTMSIQMENARRDVTELQRQAEIEEASLERQHKASNDNNKPDNRAQGALRAQFRSKY